MKVGDLVKRKGKNWYAIVVDFKKELVLTSETLQLPQDDRGYPIIRWMDAPGQSIGELDSCSAALLEVISSPDQVLSDNNNNNTTIGRTTCNSTK
jgi:hypothetical protein